MSYDYPAVVNEQVLIDNDLKSDNIVNHNAHMMNMELGRLLLKMNHRINLLEINMKALKRPTRSTSWANLI